MRVLILYFIFFYLFGIKPLLALDPEKNIKKYIVENWDIENGLPQNSAYTIIQTKDGFLWIGTQEGLARFDGLNFNVYNKINIPELKSNWILSIYEDAQGRLWIGTGGGGVTTLVKGKFQYFQYFDSLSSSRITAIAGDNDGNIWLGSDSKGVYKYSNGILTNFTDKNGLHSNQIAAIKCDSDNNIWIATDKGLNKITGNNVVNFPGEEKLLGTSLMALYYDGNSLWIGTDGKGLIHFSENKIRSYTHSDGLIDLKVRSITGDKYGNIWFGTEEDGLGRLRNGRFTFLAKNHGLSNNTILSLFFDREGSLWLGTHGGGINQLKDGKFTIITTLNGLSSNNVFAILEDRKGRIWLTTSSGINILNGNKIKILTTKDGISGNYAISLYEDKDGSIWIGTLGKGITVYKNGRFRYYNTKNGLSNNRIFAIYGDSNNNIWIGTRNGLNKISDDIISVYTTADGLTHNTIRCILEDSRGTLWFGTNGGGLIKYKNHKFSAITMRDGLASNIISTIYEDKEGTIWLGIFDGGVGRLKGGKILNFTVKDGLFDNAAYKIIEDELGYMWFSSNNGIFKVKKADFELFAEGKINKITSIAYDKGDGMKSRECNGGFQPAGWKTRDGKLLFPTVSGMVVIDPQKIRKNNYPPQIEILKLLADGQEIKDELNPINEGFKITPGTERIEIHYTALSLLNPQKINFKYRLIGYDNNWVDVGSRRVAYYTNLDPGIYEFRVIAGNSDNIWNKTGKSIRFEFLPYFYQTAWFYITIAVVILLFAYILIKWRIRNLEKREEILQELVHQRTKELEKANRKLQQLSNEDGMTKLANHRRFVEFLHSEWGRAKRNKTYITAILIDIDHFKEINDWHGHQIGDKCLISFSKKLKKVFNRPGDLVARYGGDEFIAVLPETDFKGAKHLADELRALIERSPLKIKNKGITVPMTISVGFATTIPEKGRQPDQLIKAADDALYHSKRQGRNRVNGIDLKDMRLHTSLKEA